MVSGIITKGIGGFYYVDTGNKLYECRARGLFRLKNITPMVGDIVDIEIDEETMQGYIININERKNQMMRPAVSNVDQVIVVFAAKNPNINLSLLQKFLVYAEYIKLKIVVCINKIDIGENEKFMPIVEMINSIPYDVVKTSAILGTGLNTLKGYLKNKISVFAGPSGVGKSSLLNIIIPGLELKTGEISQKTKRGVHTTRHVELIKLEFGGMVVDTPGFTSFDLIQIDEEELQYCYPEFERYINCRFPSCRHDKEPDCGIKNAVGKGLIHKLRYDSYIQMLNELRESRRY